MATIIPDFDVPMNLPGADESRKEVDWKALQRFNKNPGDIQVNLFSTSSEQSIIIRAMPGAAPTLSGSL